MTGIKHQIIVFVFLIVVTNVVWGHTGQKCGFADILTGKKEFSELKPGDAQFAYISPDGHFTIYYDKTGIHAVDGTDRNLNLVPDLVETTAWHADKAWRLMIDTIGFHPPYLFDGSFVTNYPITIKRLGNLYGQTMFNTNMDIPSVPGTNYESYIELNNDYSFADHLSENPFVRDSMGLAVTISHEFFHAVQLGYNINLGGVGIGNDLWWIEASAVLFEEALTPEINDYFEYLESYYQTAYQPVYYATGRVYGEVILSLIITSNYSREALLTIWEYILEDNAVMAVQRFLQENNSSWPELLSTTGGWMIAAGAPGTEPLYADLPFWPAFAHYQQKSYHSGKNSISAVSYEYSLILEEYSNIPETGFFFRPAEDQPLFLSVGLKSAGDVRIIQNGGTFLKKPGASASLCLARGWDPQNAAEAADFTLSTRQTVVYPNPFRTDKHPALNIYSDFEIDLVKVFTVTGECVYIYHPSPGERELVIARPEIEKDLSSGVYVYLIKSNGVHTGKLFVIQK